MRVFYPTKALLSAVLSGLFFIVCSATNFAQAEPTELVILNWSDYIDPELVEKFEQQFNVKIKEIYFESDDLRDNLVLETEAKGYDVVLINGSSLHIYRKQGWLASVDENQMPNLKYIDDRWRDAFIEARELAVPYFWGTLGIAYRSDLIDEAPSSWMDLFDPAESLRGKIGMIEDATDTFGMALKALGYSANSIDSEAIKEAERLLAAQKPYVGSYTYVGLGEDSALVSGDKVMTMIYSGDALMVQEHDENIQYVVPKEGGNIWIDYLTVMESSTKKELAWAFINFLNEPENAAQLAEFVYGPTPNTAAEKLLPAEFLEDEVIYPNEEVIARSEFYAPLRGRALKKRAMAYARLMQ